MIKKILVSQPKPSSEKSPYFEIAERLGVEFVFRPFIKVEGVSAREFRAQKISLSEHTAIVFTSRHAIDHFFQLAKELRFNVPEDMKYFCITEQVALYIQKYVQYRKRKVFFGSTGKFADLLPTMIKHKNERYFVPQSDAHNDEISLLLEAKKLHHTEGVMYRTVPNDFKGDEPFDFDMLVPDSVGKTLEFHYAPFIFTAGKEELVIETSDYSAYHAGKERIILSLQDGEMKIPERQ